MRLTQMALVFLQMFFALNLFAEGSLPTTLQTMMLFCVFSGVYSFFNPRDLTAVNSMQSNGAQIALLGAATSSLFTSSPGLAFYGLFAAIALDLFFSMTQFINENGRSIRAEGEQAMRFLEKGYNQ